MTLGDILWEAASKDLAWNKKNGLLYYEFINDEGKFEIKLSASIEKEAFIECSCPYTGLESEKNYLRLYFLSMVFNSAIYGMRRLKNKKIKK